MIGRNSLQHLFLPLWLAVLLFDLVYAREYGKRALAELSAGELTELAASVNASKNLDTSLPGSHLSKILIPRVPNTSNSTIVRNYIASTLRALKWDIEEDSFTGTTPYGPTTFTNVIATKDPDAPTKLVLAAHYDSKFFSTFPENQFVGATDSAAPCAMLLDLAEALDPLLNRRAERLENDEDDEDDNPAAYTTLQLIFFDGEEAYKDWTATDSIYGSRHLAERWGTTYVPPHPTRRLRPSSTIISTIEHLILLDLLGAADPHVQSYYPATAWLFDALISVEKRIEQSGVLSDSKGAKPVKPSKPFRSFFIPRKADASSNGWIEDDHIPFLKRGVNILHIITSPFPNVWHTLKDDASALDLSTMRKWNIIFRVFTAEYLGLRPDVPGTSLPRRTGDLEVSIEHLGGLR